MLCNNGRHAAYTGTGESASARARRRRGAGGRRRQGPRCRGSPPVPGTAHRSPRARRGVPKHRCSGVHPVQRICRVGFRIEILAVTGGGLRLARLKARRTLRVDLGAISTGRDSKARDGFCGSRWTLCPGSSARPEVADDLWPPGAAGQQGGPRFKHEARTRPLRSSPTVDTADGIL